MNSSSRSRQAGFTIWQWMVIVLVGGFLLTVGFSLAPLYINNYTVRATVQALQNEPELGRKSTSTRSRPSRPFAATRPGRA